MTRKKGTDKMSDLQWIDKHIRLNKNLAKHLLEPSKVVYNANAWTPLKLISIGFFTQMYTTIIKGYFDRWLYCGIFSGCGLNYIENRIYFPGSSFFAINSSIDNPFHKMYFIDSNKKRIKALTKRLEYVEREIEDFSFLGSTEESRCQYMTFSDDYGKFIDETDIFDLLDEEDTRTHALVVIDPEGFEMKWDDLKRFFHYPCDIIFVYMTSEIKRTWGKALKSRDFAIKNMNGLFGGSSWKQAIEGDDLLPIFIIQIEGLNKIVKTIRVKKSKSSFYYDLLVITRPTRGGNPWLSAVDQLKSRIERSGSSMVKASLDYLEGKRGRLDDFFPINR